MRKESGERERVLQRTDTWLFIIHLTNTCIQSTLLHPYQCFLSRPTPPSSETKNCGMAEAGKLCRRCSLNLYDTRLYFLLFYYTLNTLYYFDKVFLHFYHLLSSTSKSSFYSCYAPYTFSANSPYIFTTSSLLLQNPTTLLPRPPIPCTPGHSLLAFLLPLTYPVSSSGQQSSSTFLLSWLFYNLRYSSTYIFLVMYFFVFHEHLTTFYEGKCRLGRNTC